MRFQHGFIAYKNLKWWPLFDFLATYGNIANNFIFVYLSTHYMVNCYMMFNLICACSFYMITTVKVGKRASEIYF